MDVSSSICEDELLHSDGTCDNFIKQKTFIQNVIRSTTGSSSTTGVLSYSDSGNVVFNLGDHEGPESNVQAVENLDYTTGQVRTGLATEAYLQDMWPAQRDLAEQRRAQTVVLFWGGEESSVADPCVAAEEFVTKTADFHVVVVAVGRTRAEVASHLQCIAPDTDKYILLDDFTAFDDFQVVDDIDTCMRDYCAEIVDNTNGECLDNHGDVCVGCLGRNGNCNGNSYEQCAAAFEMGAQWCDAVPQGADHSELLIPNQVVQTTTTQVGNQQPATTTDLAGLATAGLATTGLATAGLATTGLATAGLATTRLLNQQHGQCPQAVVAILEQGVSLEDVRSLLIATGGCVTHLEGCARRRERRKL